MGDLIHIYIGDFANKVGINFWNAISLEHGIDKTGEFVGVEPSQQLLNIRGFYDKTTDNKYIPRAIFTGAFVKTKIDVETASDLFTNLVFRETCFLHSDNKWAVGYNNYDELVDEFLVKVAGMSESCENFLGFEITHGLEGTEGGFASKLIEKLRENYTDKIISTYSSCFSDITDQFGTSRSLNILTDNSDATYCFDYVQLHGIYFKNLKMPIPTEDDIIKLFVNAMVGITCRIRFDSVLYLKKFITNMVPFPRLHFFMVGCAPHWDPRGSSQLYRALTVHELIQQCFDAKNMMCAADPRHGKYLTCATLFRERVSSNEDDAPMNEVDVQMLNDVNKIHSYFVEWIPNSCKASICDIPPKGLKMAGTLVGNNTAINELFNRYFNHCETYFANAIAQNLDLNREFGMTEYEITEVLTKMKELIDDYSQYYVPDDVPVAEE